jgi:hypothetical protein
MMGIDDVVVNDPDVHLQSYDLAAAFGDSMSNRDSKDRSFVCMLGQKYFGCHVGF